MTAPDNTSFRLNVLARSNSPAGYVIGTQKSGAGSTATFDTTERYAGDTVFLVGKYDFTVSPNVASLWINPDSTSFGAASEPVTGFIFATNGTDGVTIDRFNIRQNAASGASSVPGSIQWDEMRFGFSWAVVTPPAPLEFVELTDFAKLGNGTFRFAYLNSAAEAYTVFASTNLIDWISIGTATQVSPGWFEFTDAEAANIEQRFYQLRAP
jgi:hypothetical protein